MMLDLNLWNATRKKMKITLADIAEKTQISISTIKDIFRGKTTDPRIETVQAIERALGLDNPPPTDKLSLSEEERRLAEMIAGMTDEEVEELSRFVDYIISKRN